MRTRLTVPHRGKTAALCGASAVALAASLALASPALANSAKAAAPGWRVVASYGGGTVSVPVYGGLTKAQWLAEFSPSMNGPTGPSSINVASLKAQISNVVTQGGGTTVYSGGNVDSGKVRTYGSTIGSYGDPGFDETMAFTKSTSNKWWTGTGNPKEIQGSMEWWLSGVDISVSLPIGVGFSSTGSGITWDPNAVSGTSAEKLNHSDAINESAFLIYDGYYTNDADMLIGSTWFDVEGS